MQHGGLTWARIGRGYLRGASDSSGVGTVEEAGPARRTRGSGEAGETPTRGLRVRCSAYSHVHGRPPVQVTSLRGPRWTVLDAGELQLELQVEVDGRHRQERADTWTARPSDRARS